MSALIRNLGTTAQFAPQIKRAVARHSDGRTFAFIPDTNRTGSNGVDSGGTAKLTYYGSTDSTRSSWTLDTTDTPPVASSSSTKKFVGSMAINSDDDIMVAYQGSDNSLRFTSYNWTGSAYAAGSDQTIVAGNAVTDRYRSIDIDVANSTTGNPTVIVYEALASTGIGAYIRVYIRLDDGTTWRKAYETQIFTTETILAGSEDVSISYGADGVVTNVARLAMYYTQTCTTADSGDTVREISFNVNSGTDGSATTVITWASAFNQNVAAGSRKAWLFKNKTVGGAACWVFGGIVGSSSPFYFGQKLTHNTAAPVLNRTSGVPAQIVTGKFAVFTATDRQPYCAVTASFMDQRLMISYVGASPATNPNCMRTVQFRWDDSVEGNACTSIDIGSRVLDNNYSVIDGSLGIYGGANQLSVGNFEYTQVAWYGAGGDSVSSTAGVFARYARAVTEDTLPAPSITQPGASSTVATGTPTVQALSTSSQFWHNAHGKLQVQLASDSGFTTNLVTADEAEANYRVYESQNGGASTIQYFINLTLTQAQRRASGTWFVRARIKDDWGGFSPYSSTVTFSISHPPAATPVSPAVNSSVPFGAGDIVFTWTLTDPDSNDTETAYQIILTTLDTGATVTDTGKVVTANRTAVITAASSLKGVPLSWKVRVWDGDDVVGLYSNPVTFSLLDAPVVVITSPAVGATVGTAALSVSWTFASTGRTQTHFRILVTDTDATPDVVVADTGWIASSATSYGFPAPILNISNNYSVSVQVRDNVGMIATSERNLLGNPNFDNNTTTGWTPTNASIVASATQKLSSPYSLKITPPGGAAPSILSTSFPATAAHQYTATAQVWSALGWTSVTVSIDWRDVADANISTDTTTLAIGASAWTPVTVTATAPGGTTQARVKVAMTGTPAGTDLLYVDDVVLRHVDTTFVTSITPPNDADTAVTQDGYKAIITWTNANQDAGFVAWRIYRRYNKAASAALDVDNTRNTWVLIYETPVVQASYTFYDYFAPLNKSVDYMVVQMAERSGSIVESSIPVSSTVTIVGDRYYFVPAIPIGAVASFQVSSVTQDNFTRTVEQETLHVINRGRQVQVGDDLGYDGELTIKLRSITTARSDREFIELLARSENGATYIRSPFGDVLYVRFGPPSFKRMEGVGATDMGDLTISYTEVFQEAQVTRTV